jgi:hypothetical protein
MKRAVASTLMLDPKIKTRDASRAQNCKKHLQFDFASINVLTRKGDMLKIA